VDIYDAIGDLSDPNANLSIDDVATGRYACSLVELLIPRSDRIVSLDQLVNNSFHPVLAASMPRMSYPWDAELVRDILTASTVSPQVLDRHLLKVSKTEQQDTTTKDPTRRSTLQSPPRFLVGDVLEGGTGAGDPSCLIVTEWKVMDLEKNTLRVVALASLA
jgi:hypothetical protein